MVLNGNCVTIMAAEGYSNQLKALDKIVYRSGFHRVTLPGILFINIRCQSRLEGNNR